MFSVNFERICKQRGVSPSAAVIAIGRGKSTASDWKRNGTIPKEAELEALAKYLDCSVADFFQDGNGRYTGRDDAIEGKQHVAQGEIDGVPIDQNIRDFIFIYTHCTKSQRARLMADIYDFEEHLESQSERDCI